MVHGQRKPTILLILFPTYVAITLSVTKHAYMYMCMLQSLKPSTINCLSTCDNVIIVNVHDTWLKKKVYYFSYQGLVDVIPYFHTYTVQYIIH